jgi:dUTP pyrophosphatase
MVGLVFPRSSIRNTELILSISVGVIDAGYRGELQATFNKLNGLDSIAYNVGDRIAQMVFQKVEKVILEKVETLEATERGAGGFGHTGKK